MSVKMMMMMMNEEFCFINIKKLSSSMEMSRAESTTCRALLASVCKSCTNLGTMPVLMTSSIGGFGSEKRIICKFMQYIIYANSCSIYANLCSLYANSCSILYYMQIHAVYMQIPAVYMQIPAVYMQIPAVYMQIPAVYMQFHAVHMQIHAVYMQFHAVYMQIHAVIINKLKHCAFYMNIIKNVV